MNTRKLFYEDATMRSCTAEVQECRTSGGHYEIVLDQTCFYPEGGGQAGDTGSIDDAEVLDTHEKDGLILHYTDVPIEPGTTVIATVNWEHRFDLMQQHSGEHMISGLIHERYGFDNVGFHMGADVTTIDLSGLISMEQLKEIEFEANRRICQNLAVKAWFPKHDELAEIPYRSKKELTGAVRLVEFPETDICACCGLHVEHTGEIGIIKILDCEKFHGGSRVTLVCGMRALRYLDAVQEQNRNVSRILSSKSLETADAVQTAMDDLIEKRIRIYELEEALFAAEAEKAAGKGDVLLFLNGLSSDAVRRACDAVQKSCGGTACIFSGTDEDGYKFALGNPKADLRELVKELNTALFGRGGGKPGFVQGSVKANRKAIEEFFNVHITGDK